MSSRQPPSIPPGPLSRSTADAITSWMRELATLVSGIKASAPINIAQDPNGVRLWLDAPAMLSQTDVFNIVNEWITNNFNEASYCISTDDGSDATCCNELRRRERNLILWDCETSTWIFYCECEGEGSGTGDHTGGCIPGTCAICTEAPWRWTLTPTAFTGECTIFNRAWVLEYISPCVWRAGAVVNGVGAVCTLTLTSGGHTLAFSGYAPSGTLVTSTYTRNNAGLPDCCTALTFTEATCACDVANVTGDLVCTECTNTPTVWYLELSNFTGCFSRFNNGPSFSPWVLVQSQKEPCLWQHVGNGIEIYWQIQSDGSGRLTMVDYLASPTATAIYTSGVFGPDCCSDVTANKSLTQCAAFGEGPATVSLQPRCSGAAPTGDCPNTLVATPICCDDLPPDEPTCDCVQCPDGAPPRWLFRQVNCTGDFFDANGDWALAWDSDCLWTQTRGAVTCTLDYDTVQARWELTFTNGTSYEIMDTRGSPFHCCLAKRFVVLPASQGGHSGIGHTDDFADLSPDGPCVPCPDGGTITTDCCASTLLPATVYITPANGAGGCACMNAIPSAALTWNGAIWAGTLTGCTGVVVDINLICDMVGWRLVLLVAGVIVNTLYPTSSACSPLEIVFHPLGYPGCAGALDLIITD